MLSGIVRTKDRGTMGENSFAKSISPPRLQVGRRLPQSSGVAKGR